MQAYGDFRVNCYPQTVIDLVTCFCKKGCIAHCLICKPLMMFCTLLCKCKWHASCLNPAIVRSTVQTRWKIYTICWDRDCAVHWAQRSPWLLLAWRVKIELIKDWNRNNKWSEGIKQQCTTIAETKVRLRQIVKIVTFVWPWPCLCKLEM